MFWLSFADSARATGDQLLGVTIVRADDMVSAIKVAHALGINPGGEVAGMWVDPDRVKSLTFELPIERLLTPSEARELSRRISEDLDA